MDTCPRMVPGTVLRSYYVMIEYEQILSKPEDIDYESWSNSRLRVAYDPNIYYATDDTYASFAIKEGNDKYVISIVLDEELRKQLAIVYQNDNIRLRELHRILRYYVFFLKEHGVQIDPWKGDVGDASD
mgnify:CR=1 FL=1